MFGELIGSAMFGMGLAVGVAAIVWFALRRRQPSKPEIQVHASIEQLRAVGELVVFKVMTKEIVTAAEHWFGETGKKYFKWLVTSRKMAMIFEFEIDFRYDLRSSHFVIEEPRPGQFRLSLPPCLWETHIRDISFYDEQESKLMPWLLPDLLTRALGAGFDEGAKNRLKEEAKYQAERMARELVNKMRSEVQSSARQTLEALARGFGAEKTEIVFSRAEPVQVREREGEEAGAAVAKSA